MSLVVPSKLMPLAWWKENTGRDSVEDIMFRMRLIKACGFLVLTSEVCRVLRKLVKGYRVLEVGAGTGWLAHHLHSAAKEYRAIDSERTKYYGQSLKTKWVGQHHKIEKISSVEVDSSHYDVVIATWLDLEGDWVTDLLDRIQEGQIFILEGEGSGGCTANDEFFSELDRSFEEVEDLSKLLNRNHYQFDGIHDRWSVYSRRTGDTY